MKIIKAMGKKNEANRCFEILSAHKKKKTERELKNLTSKEEISSF